MEMSAVRLFGLLFLRDKAVRCAPCLHGRIPDGGRSSKGIIVNI